MGVEFAAIRRGGSVANNYLTEVVRVANIDWIAIKNEYINTNISQRDLAKKFGVSASTLTKKANKEKWQQKKETQGNKIATKVQQKTADAIVRKEVNRVAALLNLHDKLMQNASVAADQLSSVLQDEEIIDIGMVDAYKLKQLTSVAKDLKDIQTALQTVTNQTHDNGLNIAIEKSAEGVWIDEIREDKPQADESLDVVGSSADCK